MQLSSNKTSASLDVVGPSGQGTVESVCTDGGVRLMMSCLRKDKTQRTREVLGGSRSLGDPKFYGQDGNVASCCPWPPSPSFLTPARATGWSPATPPSGRAAGSVPTHGKCPGGGGARLNPPCMEPLHCPPQYSCGGPDVPMCISTGFGLVALGNAESDGPGLDPSPC